MKSKLTQAMREMRKGESQQQLASELNVSRETVSAYETGRAKMPADISLAMMTKYDKPELALAMRREYTGTGAIWLDGPNVDLHHASVKEKVMEEMEEAMQALRDFNFARPLASISDWERPEVLKVLEETVEVITGMEMLAAILCKGLDISFTETWSKHHIQLKAKGFVQ